MGTLDIKYDDPCIKRATLFCSARLNNPINTSLSNPDCWHTARVLVSLHNNQLFSAIVHMSCQESWLTHFKYLVQSAAPSCICMNYFPLNALQMNNLTLGKTKNENNMEPVQTHIHCTYMNLRYTLSIKSSLTFWKPVCFSKSCILPNWYTVNVINAERWRIETSTKL